MQGLMATKGLQPISPVELVLIHDVYSVPGVEPVKELDSLKAYALAALHGAALVGRVVSGKRWGVSGEAGQKARRVQLIQGREYKLSERCATSRGYNLYAGVVVGARDRNGLEGLCRYIMRPSAPLYSMPLACSHPYGTTTRVSSHCLGSNCKGSDQQLSDGTTSLRLFRLEVMEQLAALVPPLRALQVR